MTGGSRSSSRTRAGRRGWDAWVGDESPQRARFCPDECVRVAPTGQGGATARLAAGVSWGGSASAAFGDHAVKLLLREENIWPSDEVRSNMFQPRRRLRPILTNGTGGITADAPFHQAGPTQLRLCCTRPPQRKENEMKKGKAWARGESNTHPLSHNQGS